MQTALVGGEGGAWTGCAVAGPGHVAPPHAHAGLLPHRWPLSAPFKGMLWEQKTWSHVSGAQEMPLQEPCGTWSSASLGTGASSTGPLASPAPLFAGGA